MFHIKSIYLVALLIFISCSNKRKKTPPPTDQGFIAHPIPSKMPHANVKAKLLKLKSVKNGNARSPLPQSLQMVSNYLNNDSLLIRQKSLDILTSGDIEFASLDKTNLLILDERENTLWQYNLKTNEAKKIAGQGRGPGDLIFTKDIAVFNNKFLVSMQGYKISMFNCTSGICEYEKTLKTEFNNYSITAGNENFYVLAVPPFGRDQDPDPVNTNQYTIHKFDYEGELIQSFSPIYQHRAPLVRDRMVAEGYVNFFPNTNILAATFSFFPYIYIYDDSGTLISKYKIPNFKQPYYSYKQRGGDFSGKLKYNDNSSIEYSKKVGDKWLLLRFRERRNLDLISRKEGFKGDEWNAYYVFNIEKSAFYKLGRDKKNHQPLTGGINLYPTNKGLILNKDSTITWISI